MRYLQVFILLFTSASTAFAGGAVLDFECSASGSYEAAPSDSNTHGIYWRTISASGVTEASARQRVFQECEAEKLDSCYVESCSRTDE